MGDRCLARDRIGGRTPATRLDGPPGGMSRQESSAAFQVGATPRWAPGAAGEASSLDGPLGWRPRGARAHRPLAV